MAVAIVSKSKEMVDLTMGLFAKFRVNGTIDSLTNKRLTLLSWSSRNRTRGYERRCNLIAAIYNH